MKRVHLIINGKVQGVFFRHNTRKKAIELGVKGWVRNLEDDVEVVAEGNEGRLQELIDWCQHGPKGAKVDNLQIEWEKYTGEFKKFEIRY